MSRVKNADTKPELKVRKTLHRLGYRFRLHARKLPGSPDIVLPKHRAAIFVHGCFWHGHSCSKGRRPTTRVEFWNTKLDANQARDNAAQVQLKELGWKVLVIWECELKSEQGLTTLLTDFLQAGLPGA
jgi:DNA mismatch endonuclease, patch repair protein